MKAIIVKNIETEVREVPGHEVYRAAQFTDPWGIATEGSSPHSINVTATEEVFTRMRLYDPEKTEERNYYVKLDDRELWNDLVEVSSGFVQSKIDRAIKTWTIERLPKFEFEAKRRERKRISELPWWKRLQGKF